MKAIGNVMNKIRSLIEIYVPVVTFTVMFITFIIQITMRYVFKNPLTWTFEITVICFSWTVIFGACYAMRDRSHVKFTLIYDSLSKRKAAIARALGNLIIVTAFSLLIIPSYRFIAFMSFQSTAVFSVKLSWIFMPFLYFLVSIILYTFEELIEDYSVIRGKRGRVKHKNLEEKVN
ncbi:MAG: TRAP transporter small permease [Clostridiales bacterium]|nr:TRAP transporter small permease [Clostridiales bacterium]